MAEVIPLYPAPAWAWPTAAVVSVFERDGKPVLLTRHVLSSVGGQVILNNGARFDCQRDGLPKRSVRFPCGVAQVRLFAAGDPLAELERVKIEQSVAVATARATACALEADPFDAEALRSLREGVDAWAATALGHVCR